MMRHRTKILFIILLVSIAGCSDTTDNPATPEQDQDDPLGLESRTPFQGSDSTGGYEPGEDLASDGDESRSDNPWNRERVVIAIRDGGENSSKHYGMLNRSVDYWENKGSKYRGYDVDFVVKPGTNYPDIQVVFVKQLNTCGHSITFSKFAGCAPILEKSSNPPNTVTVEIVSTQPDLLVESTIRHELGHVLGLDHNEGPGIMNEEHEFDMVQDVSDRANPWGKDTVLVYVNSTSDKGLIMESVEYYQGGADGFVPSGLDIQTTNSESKADIVVDIQRHESVLIPDCSGYGVSMEFGVVSDGRACGIDVDGDDRLEFYTSYHIGIGDVSDSKLSWHTGYWLGYALGAQESNDLPQPFNDPSGSRTFNP